MGGLDLKTHSCLTLIYIKDRHRND